MKSLRLLAVWLVLCTIWSSTWIFIKLGLNEGLPPVLFAGLRFVIASSVLIGVNALRRVPGPRSAREWAFVAATGILMFSVNYGLLFWGERQVTSGLAAVLQATIPAFGMAFAHFYLPAERLNLPKVAGVLIGLVGVGLIFAKRGVRERVGQGPGRQPRPRRVGGMADVLWLAATGRVGLGHRG